MEKEALEQKTLMELRKMAKEMGLGPISALKKGELIAKIAEKQSQSAAKNVEDVAVCGFSEETAEVPREEAHQQESGERPQRENQEQGEGILEVMTDGFGFLDGKLPARHRGHLCFSLPDSPFSAENRGRYQRHSPSGKRRGEIWCLDFCKDRQWRPPGRGSQKT